MKSKISSFGRVKCIKKPAIKGKKRTYGRAGQTEGPAMESKISSFGRVK